MKLKECLELAEACNLKTLKEAYYNVYLHAGQMFEYDKIHEELLELYKELRLYEPAKAKRIHDVSIEDAWEALNICKITEEFIMENKTELLSAVEFVELNASFNEGRELLIKELDPMLRKAAYAYTRSSNSPITLTFPREFNMDRLNAFAQLLEEAGYIYVTLDVSDRKFPTLSFSLTLRATVEANCQFPEGDDELPAKLASIRK